MQLTQVSNRGAPYSNESFRALGLLVKADDFVKLPPEAVVSCESKIWSAQFYPYLKGGSFALLSAVRCL